MKFIGREQELHFLQDKYKSNKAEFVAITGRRRIGKSALIQKFSTGKPFFKFEGLEGEKTSGQITHFTDQLKQQLSDPLLKNVQFKSWNAALEYLTQRIPLSNQKTILFFDELQWLAVEQNKLISLIKYYWDNFWKDKNLMVILCGSIASFMFNHVIRSKALYGRLTGELHLKSLPPHEAKHFFQNKRSAEEILLYLMIFGGVPKYLNEIQLNRSFSQNINSLCFTNNGLMVTEFDKIFYSHFKRFQIYLKIIQKLKDRMLSLDEIANALKMRSSGGLQRYLKQLEEAEMIKSFVSFEKNLNTKFRKYKLSDEYLCFYFQYIHPHLRTIKESPAKNRFELVSQNSWNAWIGYAFERFCLKQAAHLAKVMGFADQVLSYSPYFERGDKKFQIDLLFKRADQVITICEVKYSKETIQPKIIPEVEKKCQLFSLPKGYTLEKALISIHGASEAVKDTEYFHHDVTLQDIFQCEE